MNLVEYLNSGKRTRELVQVELPEWGKFADQVYVKQITVEEFAQQQLVEDSFDGDEAGKMLSVVVACTCNEDGELYFDASNIDQLRKERLATIVKLKTTAMQVNGLLADGHLDETLEKNLESRKDSDSGSNSQPKTDAP